MIQSRIREIRKKMGLTLQDVADRAGTTAQTIGRLETGMRMLSLKWINRIAQALEVEPSELLALPEGGDVEILAEVSPNGAVRKGAFGTLSLRLAVREPMALKFTNSAGEFRKGDILVFERRGAENIARAHGKLCLAEDAQGALYFARILEGGKKGEVFLVPEARPAKTIAGIKLAYAAPAALLVREFS